MAVYIAENRLLEPVRQRPMVQGAVDAEKGFHLLRSLGLHVPGPAVYPPEEPLKPPAPNEVNATPPEILLGNLGYPELHLMRPILLHVVIEEDPHSVVVTWNEVDEFGHGEDLTSAINDFRRGLVELYRGLTDKGVKLGADLTRVLETIKSYVAPHDAT